MLVVFYSQYILLLPYIRVYVIEAILLNEPLFCVFEIGSMLKIHSIIVGTFVTIRLGVRLVNSTGPSDMYLVQCEHRIAFIQHNFPNEIFKQRTQTTF